MPNRREKKINDNYFDALIKNIRIGGMWCWKDESEVYDVVMYNNTKHFKPTTTNGYNQLKRITSANWFKDNVVE
mgnify:CR=1 FL=1